MYQISKLENGLTVATAEMPHMASVSVGLWVGVGGRYEPAELNGVCHFIEHLLFKGTRKRSARRISQDVEGLGGYLNAFTTEEMTCYHCRATHQHFDELLDVLTDMFLNSKFDPAEIDKERSVIKEELAMYRDQPHHLVQEILNEALWPRHPLGRNLAGTEQTLDGLTRPRLLAYQRQNYAAGRTLIVAAGRLKHRQVLRSVTRLAQKFPAGAGPTFLPVAEKQTAPQVQLHVKDTEQTQLALGIRTTTRHDLRRYPLRLLNVMLGENASSRLFNVIREERGIAYSIDSALGYFDDTGTLTISAGLDLDHLRETLGLIRDELRRFKLAPPPRAEFNRARDYALGQIDLGLESADNQMNWLGEQLLGYGRVVTARQVKSRLAKVTPAEVLAVAREFFRPERLTLALVSPLKTDRGLAKLLEL